MHLNEPFTPRSCVCNSKESSLPNEARKANLDAHRIFKISAIMEVVITYIVPTNACGIELHFIFYLCVTVDLVSTSVPLRLLIRNVFI